jgi:hypothetical protein
MSPRSAFIVLLSGIGLGACSNRNDHPSATWLSGSGATATGGNAPTAGPGGGLGGAGNGSQPAAGSGPATSSTAGRGGVSSSANAAGAGAAQAGAGGASAGNGGAELGGNAQGGVSGGAALGGANGGGNSAVGTCTVEVTSASLSSVIPTVGSVEFRTDAAPLDAANIEFGLDTNYGQTAPVALSEPNFHTLVLGMKASHTYHYRVVVKSGTTSCQSADATLTTGDPPAALAGLFKVTTPLPGEHADGYLISSFFSSQGGPAFILDKDRDLVWWYTSDSDDVFRARMSYDAKSMWLRNTANQDTGKVFRVSMDGSKVDTWDLPKSTHDLAVIPDGHVALISRVTNDCDEILELDPATGDTKIVANMSKALGTKSCHVNAIAYYGPDDAFIVSDYLASSYVKLSRAGDVIWVLNGAHSNFTGDTWEKQHNLQMLSRDRILLFSNGPNNSPAKLLEFELDEQAWTAKQVWQYSDGPAVLAGGDVQRLPNGNTLGTYSIAGEIREVDPAGKLVQTISANGKAFGYSVACTSLYDHPPRIDDFAAAAGSGAN